MADNDQQQQGQQDTQAAGKKPEVETPEKKERRKGIIIVVLVVLVLVGLFFYWRSTFTEDTDDAQVDGDLYQISARVAGQVVHVDVEDQQYVHAGDPIAELDPRDLQVALDQDEAALASAKAQFLQQSTNVPVTTVNSHTDVRNSDAGVNSAQAAVQQAEASAQAARSRIANTQATALKARIDVDRYTPLVAKDVISKQQYDQAVATATSAQASLDEAERSARASEEQVREAQARLAQAQFQQQQSQRNGPKQIQIQEARAQSEQAAVQQAEARVEQAKLNLSYAKIVAPIDGIISRKNVAVGENLAIGQSLMTIVPLDNLWITANFKETQLQHMEKGQKVDVEVDALGGRHFKARVTQIGGATGSRLSLFPPENATGNYVKVVQRIPVRLDFTNANEENRDHALRPGMSVTPTVHIK
ncbi:MAG: HlyD family secretion protein [Acidobacteriaceae bacterium]|nr:HlyD family secretion protein [Acidobacteriaceae bacterium]